jgi:hypothetical protein
MLEAGSNTAMGLPVVLEPRLHQSNGRSTKVGRLGEPDIVHCGPAFDQFLAGLSNCIELPVRRGVRETDVSARTASPRSRPAGDDRTGD